MQRVGEVKNRARGMSQIKVEGMEKEKTAANSNACGRERGQREAKADRHKTES